MPKVTYPEAATSGLVTIVIPAYRLDDYIGKALRSISEQSYTNWELIVVEDASQGKTEGIVRQFAQDHPDNRVVYRRNEKNSGPSHSRNVAFLEARGEFLALLDGDDRWLNTHLAASLRVMQEQNVDLVYSSVVLIEDQSERMLGLWGPDEEELQDFPHGLFRRNFITPSATVLRRSVIADVGLWDVHLPPCEDVDYWLRCLVRGKRFAFVPGCHCLYLKNRTEALTRKRCGVQELVARVVERYIELPGARVKTCRNRTSQAYAKAALIHSERESEKDPSRDVSKIPGLYLKAWKLRPKRVDYLVRAGWWRLLNWFSKPAPPTQLPVSLQSSPSCSAGS